jgi:hypothetical protein
MYKKIWARLRYFNFDVNNKKKRERIKKIKKKK